jgi:putative transcriptional regulator
MTKKKPTAGERMIASAKQALAFAKGEENHGCTVHIPDAIDVKAIREKVDMSQSKFANMFGFSKRTLEDWEHGRRIPTGPARAFLTVTAREPEAVRRALMDESRTY